MLELQLADAQAERDRRAPMRLPQPSFEEMGDPLLDPRTPQGRRNQPLTPTTPMTEVSLEQRRSTETRQADAFIAQLQARCSNTPASRMKERFENPFSGDEADEESIEDFFLRFDTCRMAHTWNDADCVRNLMFCLTGTAAATYAQWVRTGVLKGRTCTYEEVAAKLRAHFGPPPHVELTATQRLLALVQRPGEKIRALAVRFRRVLRASSMSEDAVVVKQHFVHAIHRDYQVVLAPTIIRSNRLLEITFQELVDEAAIVESIAPVQSTTPWAPQDDAEGEYSDNMPVPSTGRRIRHGVHNVQASKAGSASVVQQVPAVTQSSAKSPSVAATTKTASRSKNTPETAPQMDDAV